MFIAQTLSETWFDDEAQHHRTQVYESWSSLVNAVENILIKFGSEYIINFA